VTSTDENGGTKWVLSTTAAQPRCPDQRRFTVDARVPGSWAYAVTVMGGEQVPNVMIIMYRRCANHRTDSPPLNRAGWATPRAVETHRAKFPISHLHRPTTGKAS